MCNSNSLPFDSRHTLRKICNTMICLLSTPPRSNEVKNKVKSGRHFLFQIDVKEDVVFFGRLKTSTAASTPPSRRKGTWCLGVSTTI